MELINQDYRNYLGAMDFDDYLALCPGHMTFAIYRCQEFTLDGNAENAYNISKAMLVEREKHIK